MESFSDRKSLPCLLVAQAQVAFNDNAAKFMLVGLATMVLPVGEATVASCILAALLVIPFIVLAPLVGWMADRFSKSTVLSLALVFQVAVMGWVIAAVHVHSLPSAMFAFSLLALQASVFSPAKYGIVKELVGSARLGMATGWMEMLTVTAILVGGFGGGTAIDHWAKSMHNPWDAARWTAILLAGGSIVALGVFQGVRHTEPQSAERFRVSILWRHFGQLADLWRSKPLRLSALGVAYFYSFGGILYLTFFQFGRELCKGDGSGAQQAGIMLATLGGGVAIGSLIAAVFCRRRIELGLVPVGALGIALALGACGLSASHDVMLTICLVLLGISAGLFTVPLNAFLQDRAGEGERGRMIAATNLMTNVGGLAGVGVYYFLAAVCNFNAASQFLILMAPTLAVALYVIWLLPESLLRLGVVVVTRCVYRIRVLGAEHLPKGGVLLISSHITYVDAIILQAVYPGSIHFVAYDAFYKYWWLRWIFKLFGVILISPHHARDAIRAAAELLKRGETVCIFPEGQLTRTGTLLGLRKGFELMARQGGAPVVPVFLDALWGSIFSFAGHRYFWKLPRKLPYPVLVNFGKPIPVAAANAAAARQALLDCGEAAFQERPALKEHLGYACLRSLSRRPWRELLVDPYPKPRKLSRGMTLALAIALSRRWRRDIRQQRVGVVLPPGIGSFVANLALTLAGKIPVNLNFTTGRAVAESCLRRGKIETIISAGAMRSRFADFPWPAQTLDAGREIQGCGKGSVLRWLAAVWIIPPGILARRLGIPRAGDREEAALLFTSGSVGEPKGVVLSHRNIIGNVAQITATQIVEPSDIILGCLPIFHSFGFTVTLWLPLLEGVRVVTVASPLDVKNIANAIRDYGATMMMAAPTFLRPYLRKVDPEQLRSMRGIITGAEKLPADLAGAFTEKFKVPIFEGYGLTETTPVVSVNLPDPEITTSTAGSQAGNRTGSVGRLIPGMTARIMDPDTGQEKSPWEVGMLWLRGPNIFCGYLDDPEKTGQVLRDGWFVTGDLARFDEEGFLFIEGRLSRFSKIGGEMVPHGTVEQKIIEVFNLDASEVQTVAVVGIPDESKGEMLVLLTAVDISAETLREKLAAAGLPNLWIPRTIKRIERIPVLASGKLDLKGCAKVAVEKQM